MRSHPSAARWATFSAALALVTLLAACPDDGPRYVRPIIGTLRVDGFFSVLRDSGLVAISGTNAWEGPRVGERDRVRIMLRASSGDSESVDLERKNCGAEDRQYLCTSLVVTMQAGHTVYELVPRLEPVPARIWLTSEPAGFGRVRVFGTGLVDAAMRVLSGTPVLSVERDYVGSPGQQAVTLPLFGAIRLDFRPVTVGNGRLEAAPGDSLIASYVQPTGPRLEALRIMP